MWHLPHLTTSLDHVSKPLSTLWSATYRTVYVCPWPVTACSAMEAMQPSHAENIQCTWWCRQKGRSFGMVQSRGSSPLCRLGLLHAWDTSPERAAPVAFEMYWTAMRCASNHHDYEQDWHKQSANHVHVEACCQYKDPIVRMQAERLPILNAASNACSTGVLIASQPGHNPLKYLKPAPHVSSLLDNMPWTLTPATGTSWVWSESCLMLYSMEAALGDQDRCRGGHMIDREVALAAPTGRTSKRHPSMQRSAYWGQAEQLVVRAQVS